MIGEYHVMHERYRGLRLISNNASESDFDSSAVDRPTVGHYFLFFSNSLVPLDIILWHSHTIRDLADHCKAQERQELVKTKRCDCITFSFTVQYMQG